jgi:hypothetical protein
MGSKPGKLDRFDSHLTSLSSENPWQPDGSFRSDFPLLQRLLSVAAGATQRSGLVAGAVDLWAAEELRRAGFHPDEVWPRRTAPRVLPRDVRHFVDDALPSRLRSEVKDRFASSAARRALPAEAHIMGSVYTKQSDVLIASWSAGVELLISSKTMLSSYQKNLRNRFEEGYGDAKNIRGRHPLAALGFLFVAGSDIPQGSMDFAIDMLRKLTTESDVYDCACLLVVEGLQGFDTDDEPEKRGPEDEPASLLAIDVPATNTGEGDLDPPQSAPRDPEDAPATINLQPVRSPIDLHPDTFFERLISTALKRMPVSIYPDVRKLLSYSPAKAPR